MKQSAVSVNKEANKLEACIIETAAQQEEHARGLLLGRKARVLSNYNGQMYGRSKPSLRGKVLTIEQVSVHDGRIVIWLEGYRYGCPCLYLSEIQVVD